MDEFGALVLGFLIGAIVSFVVVIKNMPYNEYSLTCNGKIVASITIDGSVRKLVSSNGCDLLK